MMFPQLLGPELFWRCISCFARAYLYLIGQLSGRKTEEEYYEILCNPDIAIDSMGEKAKNHIDDAKKNSYYKVLAKYDYDDICVVTTNYTSLCETITGKKVAYIHGKFGLFEDAKHLTVHDYSELKKAGKNLPNELLFPFISIQSGIKPVVGYRQVKEFNKMIDYMDGADHIIVLGYKLNPDDDHINSILRTMIVDKNKRVMRSMLHANQRHMPKHRESK